MISVNPGRRVTELARRAAPLVLLATAGAVFAGLGPVWPRDHEITFDLGSAADSLVALETTWTEVGAADTDPTLGASFHFRPGTAPRSLHTKVRVADGSFVLSAVLEREDGRRTEVSRRVELDAHITIIHLETKRAEEAAPSAAPVAK